MGDTVMDIIKELNNIIGEQPTSKIGCIAGLSNNLIKFQQAKIETLEAKTEKLVIENIRLKNIIEELNG